MGKNIESVKLLLKFTNAFTKLSLEKVVGVDVEKEMDESDIDSFLDT
jgi:hypothetical protein